MSPNRKKIPQREFFCSAQDIHHIEINRTQQTMEKRRKSNRVFQKIQTTQLPYQGFLSMSHMHDCRCGGYPARNKKTQNDKKQWWWGRWRELPTRPHKTHMHDCIGRDSSTRS